HGSFVPPSALARRSHYRAAEVRRHAVRSAGRRRACAGPPALADEQPEHVAGSDRRRRAEHPALEDREERREMHGLAAAGEPGAGHRSHERLVHRGEEAEGDRREHDPRLHEPIRPSNGRRSRTSVRRNPSTIAATGAAAQTPTRCSIDDQLTPVPVARATPTTEKTRIWIVEVGIRKRLKKVVTAKATPITTTC